MSGWFEVMAVQTVRARRHRSHRGRSRLRKPVPLIDGVSAAVMLTEALAGLEPRPPRKGSFAHPSPKPAQGLSPALMRRITGKDNSLDEIMPRCGRAKEPGRKVGAAPAGASSCPRDTQRNKEARIHNGAARAAAMWRAASCFGWCAAGSLELMILAG